MQIETEARLLWATHDESGCGAMVASAARDIGLAAQICSPRDLFEIIRPARFDFVGVELGHDAREGIALIRQLHDRFPRLTIVAAIAESGVATLRAALEAGASDVVSLPLSQHELQKTFIKFRQSKAREAQARGVVGDLITVYGVRGGLGTTTTAVNLAVQFAALTSTSVALADFDFQRGDVATFLNLTHIESIASIATSKSDIDEIFLHGTLTRHASGISVLPAPQQIEEADTVGHDEAKLVLQLLRSQFRHTIVDTPRTITGSTVAAFELADHIVLITDLSIPSVRAARRFLDLLERLNVGTSRVGIVVTELVRGPVDLKDLSRSLGKEPLVTFPRDDAGATHAMNSGSPLNGGKPAGLSVAVQTLAMKLAGVQQQPAARASFLRRMFAKEASSS
jgi:pilus assembly protein CpaE